MVNTGSMKNMGILYKYSYFFIKWLMKNGINIALCVIKNGFALFCYVIVTKQLAYPLSNMVDIG
jgi:hypothetical protein